jgi:hypothetical protein
MVRLIWYSVSHVGGETICRQDRMWEKK